jgi:hypothetical protein
MPALFLTKALLRLIHLPRGFSGLLGALDLLIFELARQPYFLQRPFFGSLIHLGLLDFWFLEK